MRKLLHSVVLLSFALHQVAWAIPLDWKPNFQSASVLPYHIDDQGRRWVLLSKKTYPDKDYGAPSWGDFGGKVEADELPITAAVRELAEETANQITTTVEELQAGSYHQIDMKNSPFGDEGIRRHTIFFKVMLAKILPTIEEGIEHGPTADGSREVSQYQWILAKDLLEMRIPGIFGDVLGLYTPETLSIGSTNSPEKNEHFSIPFFVLLQQLAVKNILLKNQESREFSQIVFNRSGFQDWRLVNYGLLGDAATDDEWEKRQNPLDFDPAACEFALPTMRLRLFHQPTFELHRFNLFQLKVGSPNYWSLEFPPETIRQENQIRDLMNTYLKSLKVL